MRAAIMHKAGDVRIETVPDAAILHPTDALIRVVRACICGSDLGPTTTCRRMARPGRVFDRVVGLEDVPDGYRAMNERTALNVMVRP